MLIHENEVYNFFKTMTDFVEDKKKSHFEYTH